MTIKDKLNLQKKHIELLEKGSHLFLETEKHRRLEVSIMEENLE